jgi:hypothetical protein
MEEWSGARLLHRTTRKLTLTTAGTQMLPLCREMLRLAEDMEATVAEREGEPRGQLRITTSAVFAHPHMTDAVMAYLARYPATSVDLQVVDRTVNLIEERIDLAIRITNNLDPNLIARKIGTLEKEEGVSELKMNDIAEITIHTANPLVFDKYTENKVTGSLIFIDPDTNETVGAGLIK